MYIIKSLNDLYKEIKGFLNGSSYIQEGIVFKVEVECQEKELKFEEGESLNIYSQEENLISISYDDIIKSEKEVSEKIFESILSSLSIKEFIEGTYLENIYAAKLKAILNQKTNIIYHVKFINEISKKTNKPFMILKNSYPLNIKTKEIKDNKLYLTNCLENGKEEKLEYNLI